MALYGGGAELHLFRINSTHTQIQDAAGTSAAVDVDDAFYKFLGNTEDSLMLGNSLTYDDGGVPTFTLDTLENSPAFTELLKVASPKKATAETRPRAEQIGEGGAIANKAGAAGSAVPRFLFIYYGAVHAATGKRKIEIFIGSVKINSGTRTVAAPDQPVKITFEVVGEAAKADVSVAAAFLNDELVNATTPQVLAKDNYVEEAWIAIPA